VLHREARSLAYVAIPLLSAVLGLLSALMGLRAVAIVGCILLIPLLLSVVSGPVPAILALLVFVVLPQSPPSLALGGIQFAWGLEDLLIPLVAGSYLLSSLRRLGATGRSLRVSKLTTIDKAMLLYYLCLLVPWARDTVATSPVLAAASYVKALEALMVYVAVRLSTGGPHEAQIAFAGFRVATAGVIIVGLIQFALPGTYAALVNLLPSTAGAYAEPMMVWRVSGPFRDANSLGVFLILGLVLLATGFASRHGRMRLISVVDITFVVAGIAVLILTQSRESFLGFIVVVIYYLSVVARIRTSRSSAVLLAGAAILCCFLLWPVIHHRVVVYTFEQGATPWGSILNAGSTRARLDQWIASGEAILRYGLIGSGASRVGLAVGQFLPSGSLSVGGIHQTYLRALVEGGLLEFVGLIVLLRSIWVSSSYFPKDYRTAVRASFCGLVITGFFGDTFQNIDIMVPLAYVLAAAQGFSGTGKRNRAAPLRPSAEVHEAIKRDHATSVAKV